MARLIIHPGAKSEILEAARWYDAQREGLGRRFVDLVRQGTRVIRSRPLMFRVIDGACRRYIIKGFPYAIIYTSREDVVYVLAVMHMKRQPGYWRGRWDDLGRRE